LIFHLDGKIGAHLHAQKAFGAFFWNQSRQFGFIFDWIVQLGFDHVLNRLETVFFQNGWQIGDDFGV
jgi:hypothetical protein